MRNIFKRLLSIRFSEYGKRLKAERDAYRDCENVHDLPEIFHYWSNKYLVPMMEPFGFTNPDDFIALYFEQTCKSTDEEIVKAVSIGSGNCDLEVELARKLINKGVTGFQIECLDLNPDMLRRGRKAAGDAGVGDYLTFTKADFNKWEPASRIYHVVIANQSLHHVLDLEHLFDSVADALVSDGKFLISDMIGRNGHMRWPEALTLVHEFWCELPSDYRYNQLIGREEKEYINHDCSTSGFEGIRAQDILPLLLERFNFEFFLPYGNIIFPFIDRAFGHNFDEGGDWDKDFIDRVHATDEAKMISGDITPTSMLAVVCLQETETMLRDSKLTPEACIRRQ